MNKTGGRPPLPGLKRDKVIQVHLTNVDYQTLARMVEATPFRAVSTLVAAIVEPIVQGRFSVESAALSVNRIQALIKGPLPSLPGRDLFAPPPHVSMEIQDLPALASDLQQLLDDVRVKAGKPPAQPLT